MARLLVTNRGAAPLGLAGADGTTIVLPAGASRLCDLADHPVHAAWTAAGLLAGEPAGPGPSAPPVPRRRKPLTRRRSR